MLGRLTLIVFAAFSFNVHGVVVGSKTFTESYILAEIAAQKIESIGASADRRMGLGGTGVLFEALTSGEIDLYPEYTGTIAEAILKDAKLANNFESLQSRLSAMGLQMSRPLGFNNTYALAARKSFAEHNRLRSISDLKDLPSPPRVVFSNEFLTRADGYRPLIKTYGLKWGKNARSLEHSLAYEAIRKNEADVIVVYSTDAKISKFDLQLLRDDLNFFPKYEAVYLARQEFVESDPQTWATLNEMSGKFSEAEMIELNAKVDFKELDFHGAAKHALGDLSDEPAKHSIWPQIQRRTGEHLLLVGLSLLFAVGVGLPLGVLAAKRAGLGRLILSISGVVQTIPSLALLCFLIPLFGIGVKPALVALTLYGLLPIVLNTYIGIDNIGSKLKETAAALGLSSWERLRYIELPLASPSILGGIRTSATIGIGTATLAALIGAGGYGAPIVTGLAINDIPTVLTGAIPAAILALVTQALFAIIAKVVLPRGL